MLVDLSVKYWSCLKGLPRYEGNSPYENIGSPGIFPIEVISAKIFEKR